MTEPKIKVEEARRDVQESDALLVCAYDDQKKCEKHHLEGAITLNELQSREDQLSKEHALIFYCA